MKRKLLLFRGVFNYSHEVIITYSMAPTWAKAKNNMIARLAKDHGVNRGVVAAMFNGDKDNFEIGVDPDWRGKKGNETQMPLRSK